MVLKERCNKFGALTLTYLIMLLSLTNESFVNPFDRSTWNILPNFKQQLKQLGNVGDICFKPRTETLP